MDAVSADCRLALLRQQSQMIGHVDAPNYEHATLSFNLTYGFRRESAFTRWYLARLQRAPEGAGQSASSCGDKIIEGGGVRSMHLGIDPIVLSHLRMNAKEDGFWLDGEVGAAQGSFHPLDANP